MIVTAKRGKGSKIHVFADGEYSFTTSTDFWYTLGVRCGEELDSEEFDSLLRRAGENRALSAAVGMLSHRDHSARELEKKLALRADAQSAQQAVRRLEELGYVDDERYAGSLAQQLYERRGMAPRRIEQELRRRGVAHELARDCAADLEGCEQERITQLLQTKFAGRLSDEKSRRRTFDALARLGYSYSQIKSAMRPFLERENNGGEDCFDE